MKNLRFVFISMCLVNFNIFTMQEQVTILAQGSIPQASSMSSNVLQEALNNTDLFYEQKKFKGNDNRKNNYLKVFFGKSHERPIQVFGGNLEKPFSCSQQCNNTNFYTEIGLMFHFWRNHHYCLVCNFFFNNADGLEEHLHRQHPFFCHQCYFYFNSFDELKAHNTMHDQISDTL